MAFLEKFTPEEREILVSLPYRTGLWIMAANGVEFSKRRAQEKTVLENVILKKSQDLFESVLVYEVMTEICARRDDWLKWDRGHEDIPAVCQKAKEIIVAKLGRHDLNSYRQIILNIAISMANSFGESEQDSSTQSQEKTYRRKILERISALTRRKHKENDFEGTRKNEIVVVDHEAGADAVNKDEWTDFLNTSENEHIALAKIAHAFSVDE